MQRKNEARSKKVTKVKIKTITTAFKNIELPCVNMLSRIQKRTPMAFKTFTLLCCNQRIFRYASCLVACALISLQASENADDYDVEMDTSARLSIGASDADVFKIMGTPSKTNEFAGCAEYYFGKSLIKSERGALVQWYTVDRALPVFVADRKPDAPAIVIGSTTNEVLDAMGTPTGLIIGGFSDKIETWFYGASSIRFQNGQVKDWRDAWNLVVSPKTNAIGSDPDFIAKLVKPTVKTNAAPLPFIRLPEPVEARSQPVAGQTTVSPGYVGSDFDGGFQYNGANSSVRSSGGKEVYVHGYTKQNGTYVAPYYRSAPRRR